MGDSEEEPGRWFNILSVSLFNNGAIHATRRLCRNRPLSYRRVIVAFFIEIVISIKNFLTVIVQVFLLV